MPRTRQCRLVGVSRSASYYEPEADSAEELELERSAFVSLRGVALLELGRLDEAMDMADAALAVDPASFRPHAIRGIVRCRQGDIEGARAAFKHYIELMQPDMILNLRVRYWLAEIGADDLLAELNEKSDTPADIGWEYLKMVTVE